MDLGTVCSVGEGEKVVDEDVVRKVGVDLPEPDRPP